MSRQAVSPKGFFLRQLFCQVSRSRSPARTCSTPKRRLAGLSIQGIGTSFFGGGENLSGPWATSSIGRPLKESIMFLLAITAKVRSTCAFLRMRFCWSSPRQSTASAFIVVNLRICLNQLMLCQGLVSLLKKPCSYSKQSFYPMDAEHVAPRKPERPPLVPARLWRQEKAGRCCNTWVSKPTNISVSQDSPDTLEEEAAWNRVARSSAYTSWAGS